MNSISTVDEQQLQVLMARQPIYTKTKEVVAFELLFRDESGQFVKGLKDDEATLNVLLNTYSSVPDKSSVRQAPLFLKVNDTFLLEHDIPEIPRESFVLEVIGSTAITPKLVERIDFLVKEGFKVALADYDPTDPRFNALLNLVHIVKIDLRKFQLDELPNVVRQLRRKGMELLADKVETVDEFQACQRMGFDLFMGYFLSKPQLVRGRRVQGNKLVLLQILTELNNPNATSESIEALALRDPELVYKILRVINSAAFSLRREVTSLAHAISLLGLDQIRRWVMLFLSVAEEGQPQEMTRAMLQRGRMCEVTAEMLERANPMNHFFVGLLSQLDALIEIPMDELMAQVPLDQRLKAAILKYADSEGEILQNVEFYERGDFAHLRLPLEKPYLEVAYRHSISWALQVLTQMVEEQ